MRTKQSYNPQLFLINGLWKARILHSRCCSNMANLPAKGLTSWGTKMQDQNTRGDEYIIRSFDYVIPRVLKYAGPCEPGRRKVVAEAETNTMVRDLPIEPLVTTKVTHLLDFVMEYEGEVDTEMVFGLFKSAAYGSLPPPFRTSQHPSVPFSVQIAIVPSYEPDKLDIIKWYRLDYAITAEYARLHIVTGEPMQVQSIPAARKNFIKVLHHMFENLPGIIMLNDYFNDEKPTSVKKATVRSDPDRAKRAEGYRYIEKFGPKANNRNQFNIWTDDNVLDESSPVFGWSPALVKESLANYAKGRDGANIIDRWPLTLSKLHPDVFNKVMLPILSTHDIHGSMWIGLSRTGKSSIVKTMFMAVSGYEIHKRNREGFGAQPGSSTLIPSLITAQRLDFFRLEPGSVYRPACCDDIPLTKVDPGELKFIVDPAEMDALVWARWGGSSFARKPITECLLEPA